MNRTLLGAALAAAVCIACAPAAPSAAHAARRAPAKTPVSPSGDQVYFGVLCGRVAMAYDSLKGGFVDREAPAHSAITLALAVAHDRGDALWMARARQSVEWTWSLYDSVGGGFFDSTPSPRSGADAFEKHTYSNARSLENLIEAREGIGDTDYERRAARVVDYFDRVLLDARGGFVDGQIGDRNLLPRSDGAAIHAWLEWAAFTGDPRYRDFALKSLDRAWTVSWDPIGGMLRRGTFDEILQVPQLIDQAEMGRAYVLATHLGGRAGDLERAKEIARVLVTRFEDTEKGGWRTQSAADKKSGKIKRAARLGDENARAALFLCELASVTGDHQYRDAARRGIRAFADEPMRDGFEAADWALAVRALDHPDLAERPQWKKINTALPPREAARRYR